jgi:hypothetical protein
MTPDENLCPTCDVPRDETGRHLWRADPPAHNHSYPDITWVLGCPACAVHLTPGGWTPVPSLGPDWPAAPTLNPVHRIKIKKL